MLAMNTTAEQRDRQATPSWAPTIALSTAAVVLLLSVYAAGYLFLSDVEHYGPLDGWLMERQFSNHSLVAIYRPAAWFEGKLRGIPVESIYVSRERRRELELGLAIDETGATTVLDCLADVPEVARVDVVQWQGERHLSQLCDYHWISREAFLLDGGQEEEYESFLQRIDLIQQEQMQVLRALGARTVWVEGQSDETIDDFRRHIERMRAVQPGGDSPVDELVRELYFEDLLQIGAAGRLLLLGEIDEVLPLEDHAAWRAAKPVAGGQLAFDEQTGLQREKAMVAKLREHSDAIIVLGSGHDLRQHIGQDTSYVRIHVQSDPESP
jgi:hypothetical protein